MQDFWDKYSKVYEIFRRLKPELIGNLKDWEELFKQEYRARILNVQR